VSKSVSESIYLCVYVYMYVYVRVYVHVYMCMCMYVRIRTGISTLHMTGIYEKPGGTISNCVQHDSTKVGCTKFEAWKIGF
jgi:hypothetical protein